MCGRYASSASVTEIVEEFDVALVDGDIPGPRWNIAPTDPVAAVVERLDKASGDDVRKLVPLRWGLVPSWAKGPDGAARMINARSETVAEKPSFRKAFAQRRCLVPADGYYEWYATSQVRGGRPVKQPFYIRPESGLFVMAGIYEFWKSPTGEWLSSCAIITTSATDELGHIHDRMPMTVPREAWDEWLSPSVTDAGSAQSLMMVPEGMVAYAVSTAVNKVGNDGPQLVEPIPETVDVDLGEPSS